MMTAMPRMPSRTGNRLSKLLLVCCFGESEIMKPLLVKRLRENFNQHHVGAREPRIKRNAHRFSSAKTQTQRSARQIHASLFQAIRQKQRVHSFAALSFNGRARAALGALSL